MTEKTANEVSLEKSGVSVPYTRLVLVRSRRVRVVMADHCSKHVGRYAYESLA